MTPALLFYAADESGAVTGPHMAAVIRRKLEAGEMTWESLVCVHGTQDWMPAHVYEDVIDPGVAAAARRADEERRARAVLYQAAAAETAGDKRRAAAARGAFLAAFVFTVAGIFFPGIWWPLCIIVCAVVAMVNGSAWRAVLSWPLLLIAP